MYKRIKQNGNVTLYAIDMAGIGCIVKVVDGGKEDVLFIPGVTTERVVEASIARREFIPIVPDTDAVADDIGDVVADIMANAREKMANVRK